MSGYYLMHCVDGDECLVAHTPDFAQCESKLREWAASDSRAALSIWSAGGQILALWDNRKRRLTMTRAGEALAMVQS